MQIGLVGLGRMGENMALRLLAHGHDVVVNNRSPGPQQRVAAHGATAANSPQALVAALTPPRTVWLMVPAGSATDAMMDAVLPALDVGDTLIDGGNSYYKDTLALQARLRSRDQHAFGDRLLAVLREQFGAHPVRRED